MSFASSALSITGGSANAVGALIQGQQQSDALNYQAKIQSKNAYEATAAASLNADRQDLIAAKSIGGTKAGYAAAGVDASSGSVMDVLAASAANAELDRQNIIHGGDLRAVNYENQASMDRLGASNAIKASYFNALSSLVGGASSAVSNYSKKSKSADTGDGPDSGDSSSDSNSPSVYFGGGGSGPPELN